VSETGRQPPGSTGAHLAREQSAGQAPGYDPRRARPRLALIEQQVTLAEALATLQEAAARPAVPPGIPDLWEPAGAEAERAAADARHWMSELTPVAADPEAVADEDGRLPRERREEFLVAFAAKVSTEAVGLHQKLPALRTALRTTRGRQERAAVRDELRQGTARLAYLQALPAFTAADMCSECPRPMAWHSTGVTFCLETGAVLSEPCQSWPVWNAKVATGLARVAEMLQQKQKTPVSESARELIAVIAAGSSVEDVIAELTRVKAEHPGAAVRRGKRDSWEIWSAADQRRPG
jgi:hypothetical protein